MCIQTKAYDEKKCLTIFRHHLDLFGTLHGFVLAVVV